MKTKHWTLIIVLLILTCFLIINGNLQFKDVVFIYLIIMIPGYVFSNLEYLFKKKLPYHKFMTNKLFVNAILVAFVFGYLIFLTSPRYISKELAVKDFNYMVNTLENVHPDIYHTFSKDSFSLELESSIEKLPEQVKELEFLKTCAKLTSLFRTGHTKPMKNFLGAKFLLKRAFPYQTKIIDDKLFVIGNLSLLNRIPIGSEIVEINDKTINQLIAEWSNLVSYENEAFRNYQITKPFRIGIWNDFKSFNVTYVNYKSNETIERSVNGGVFSNMYSFLKSQLQKPKKLFYQELTPQIGYIGFFDCHDLKGYKHFFKSTFSELKNKDIDNLIIDIRGNGGGHTIIGAELMQYIFHQPFKEVDSIFVKVSNELIATGKVKRKLGSNNKEVGKLYSIIPKPYQLRENSLRFNGKTYLLTDNGTFSAGQVIASSYSCFSKGIIIGEETGGVTVNFGNVHLFNLPNTKLKMMTSWEHAYSACGIDNQRGVIPDFTVSNSIDDDIRKNDKVLEFAIDLINDKQKTK